MLFSLSQKNYLREELFYEKMGKGKSIKKKCMDAAVYHRSLQLDIFCIDRDSTGITFFSTCEGSDRCPTEF